MLMNALARPKSPDSELELANSLNLAIILNSRLSHGSLHRDPRAAAAAAALARPQPFRLTLKLPPVAAAGAAAERQNRKT
jgi:hypothetical protein